MAIAIAVAMVTFLKGILPPSNPINPNPDSVDRSEDERSTEELMSYQIESLHQILPNKTEIPYLTAQLN